MKPSKGSANNSPAVHGVGKAPVMRDFPPTLPSMQKHLHGMPMPIKVKVKDGMGAPKPTARPSAPPMPPPNATPTGGTRKRQRTR